MKIYGDLGSGNCLKVKYTADRLGLPYVIVSATSGAMGGSASEEFLCPLPVGEDRFVRCVACGHAANVEAFRVVAPPAGRDRVEWYLFTTREGPCDLVGSAMALLCRSIGIPARVATGYACAKRDAQTGAYHVTQKDAHLWVELFFPGRGWVTFNPAPTLRNTPPADPWAVAALVRRLRLTIARGGMATVLALLMIVTLGGAGARTRRGACPSRSAHARGSRRAAPRTTCPIVVPEPRGGVTGDRSVRSSRTMSMG